MKLKTKFLASGIVGVAKAKTLTYTLYAFMKVGGLFLLLKQPTSHKTVCNILQNENQTS